MVSMETLWRLLPACRKLLDPGLSSSSRQSMFLNLLYKSLKADIVLRRVKAFVKRLLQVSAEQSASFACGALFLLSEVMKGKPGLTLLLQQDGVRGSPCWACFRRREVGSQLILLLNRLSVKLILTNARFSSVSPQDGEEEEFKDLAEEEDEDEEERFVDADKLEEGASKESDVTKPAASWVHHQNLEGRRF